MAQQGKNAGKAGKSSKSIKGGRANKGGGDKTTRILVIGMVVFVLAVGAIFTVISNHNRSVVNLPSSVSKADGYGIVFNPTKKVQVDLWEDFQCPNCQRFEAANNAVINQVVQTAKAKVVFHTMSFIGPESVSAAAAGACAADEGKFLAMHSALYQNQGASENSGVWTNQKLELIAAGAGVTSDRFISCVNNGKYLNWTKNIEDDAAKKNVTATPTVFINGKEVPLSVAYDNAAFTAALKKAGAL